VGNLARSAMFGYTQPYMFDRPLQFGFTVFGNRYNFDQARQIGIFSGTQTSNLPNAVAQNLQNYSQQSVGFTTSVSYPLHRSFKRVGITYSLDQSSLLALSTASRTLFDDLAFRGITGPQAVNGIITSKAFPNFSVNTLDSGISPHSGHSMTVGAEIAGLGGTVRSIRPTVQYKRFFPMQNRRNTFGMNFQASYITGFGTLVAPPFQRFYMGGEYDVRGFDTRSISPVAFLPYSGSITLTNPDGTPVPKDPLNPRKGNWTIPIPVDQIVFPGGDLSMFSNYEYRITIAGPVAVAPFLDVGVDPILRPSQLQIALEQYDQVISTLFGCPTLDAGFNCLGGKVLSPTPSDYLQVLSSSNWRPRMSTGIELQTFLPIVNAPFRIYWAYNMLRLDTLANSPIAVKRSMFPTGAAGDYTYGLAKNTYSPTFLLREPRKTFRFTVATTF
jgi:outer membrane protein insertion porin family